jgi:hypothetical protein
MSLPKTFSGRTRPIEKFANAVAQCSAEASAYGKCIVADYNNVHKDKCLTDFLRLKDCYVVSVWSLQSQKDGIDIVTGRIKAQVDSILSYETFRPPI